MTIAILYVTPSVVTCKEERLFLELFQYTLITIQRGVLPTVEKQDMQCTNIKQYSV